MKKKEILKAFARLNEVCRENNIKGEIGVVGGAAMVLAYGADRATKDVDAVFEPSSALRRAAQQISTELQLPEDWLNDAVKGFMPENQPIKNPMLQLDSLLVWVPEPTYMLAMKAISARFDSKDSHDIVTLCKILKIKNQDQVFEIIEKYYPKKRIPPKTIFFIEELFDGITKKP